MTNTQKGSLPPDYYMENTEHPWEGIRHQPFREESDWKTANIRRNKTATYRSKEPDSSPGCPFLGHSNERRVLESSNSRASKIVDNSGIYYIGEVQKPGFTEQSRAGTNG